MNNFYIFSSAAEELQRNIQRLKSKSMKLYGLGSSDMACIMTLKQNPDGLTSTELSRECHVDKALVSRTVKKLLEMNIIAYETPRLPKFSAEDKKKGILRRGAYRIRLKLTEQGNDMVDNLYDIAAKAAAYATDDIDAAEMNKFIQTLTAINERFRNYTELSDEPETVEASI
jgi:DNA-binding MarR family transcriptional regulator